MRVFLSAVSAQFPKCRRELASDLRAIGCEVAVQEDFQQGGHTLLEKIEEYVAGCDRVICLVGDASGYEASGDAVPAARAGRSYTQWEWYLARGERLDGSTAAAKHTLVYFASDAYLRAHPVAQSAHRAETQRRFTDAVRATGKHWATFDGIDHLCRLVLRDGWQMEARPRRPCNLPFATLGPLFKGRDAVLDDLRRRLRDPASRATAVVTRHAVHGLGGVGKTRLAVEYAHRHRDEYAAVLFVGASSPEALDAKLAALCDAGVLDLPARMETDQAVRVAAAVRWLQDHPGWLLILDNADTKEAATAVEGLVGRLSGGHVLVTARISEWSASIGSLPLDVLPEDDAVAFLLERTEATRTAAPDEETAARDIARELGGLASALEQAGAYVAHLRISLAEYLRRWRERHGRVREWFDARTMQYDKSVAVTWEVTFQQLDAPARAMLNILCWLAPDPIPRALFEGEAGRAAVAAGAALLGETAGAATDPEGALATLAAFSLLRWEDGSALVRVHRLVQDVTRRRIDDGDWARSIAVALDLLNQALQIDLSPDDTGAWGRWRPLAPHLDEVLRLVDGPGGDPPIAGLMNRHGRFLHHTGRWSDAERWQSQALILAQTRYGATHPHVARCLSSLGCLLLDLNRIDESVRMLRRALEIDRAALGVAHDQVATDLNNLAQALAGAQRPSEAEPLLRRALEIDQANRGRLHPKVAVRLNNLALLLQETRPDEAERFVREALEIDEAHDGPTHPIVAVRLGNLAQMLRARGQLAEAKALTLRSLAINEATYGSDHPFVAIDLNNLARIVAVTEDSASAVPLLRRSVEILMRYSCSAGSEHPRLRVALGNLAGLLGETGLSDDAVHAQLSEIASRHGLRVTRVPTLRGSVS